MGMRDLFTAILRADARGMLAELKDVQQQVAHTADRVRTGFGNIRESVAGGVTSFVNARPAIGGALNAIGIDSAKAGSAIGTALPGAAAAGAAALGAFAAKAVASTMQLDAGILAVQRATGATAQNASALVAIADDFGLGADQIADSLGKLAKNADSKVLAEFGVQLAKNSDGTTDLYGTLVNLADVFTSIQDPTERARLANAAFGKSWQNLLPILEQGRAGLEGAYKEIGDGQIRTQEQIDASEELRLTFDALSDAAGGLSITVGTALIPTIQTLSDALLNVKDGFDVLPFDAIGTAADFVASRLKYTQLGVISIGSAIADFVGLLDDTDEQLGYVGGSIRAVTESTTKNAASTRDMNKAQKDSEKAAKDAAKAQDDLGKAIDNVRLEFDAGKVAADAFNRILRDLVGDTLDNQAAADRWEASWSATIATLREGRGSLDATTEAGRKNREAIRGQIKDMLDYVRVMLDQGKSLDEIKGLTDNHRLALIEQMTQYGMTEDAAAEYLAQLGLTPETVTTLIDLRNADVAQKRIDAVREALAKLPPEIRSTITPVVDEASAIKAEDQIAVLTRLRTIQLQAVLNGSINAGNIGGILPGAVSGMSATNGNVININLPPGTDGEDVIAAQTRWQRRNGVTF